MLARYKLYRGKRPADDPLPQGTRMDTRKHTRHCLRPEAAMVERVLADPSDRSWAEFRKAYARLLQRRIADDPTPFDELAEAARGGDVYIGCSCPSRANPDVMRCHTTHALDFMKGRYPDLDVRPVE